MKSINYFKIVLFILLLLGTIGGFLGWRYLNPQYKLNETKREVAEKGELKFTGRLTSANFLTGEKNPYTTEIETSFRIYSREEGSYENYGLWSSTECLLSLNSDGIFEITLGKDCGDPIPNTIWDENTETWLGVTLSGQEELKPRYIITTANARTVDGFSVSQKPTANQVLVLDDGGDLNIASSSPNVTSTSGIFTLSGKTIFIESTEGTIKLSAATGLIFYDVNTPGGILLSGYDRGLHPDLGDALVDAINDTYLAAIGESTTSVWTRVVDGETKYVYPTVAGKTAIVVKDNGNIGIGVIDPQKKLEVAGEGQFSSTLTAKDGLTLEAGELSLSGTGGLINLLGLQRIGLSAVGPITLGGTTFTLENGGKVSIGILGNEQDITFFTQNFDVNSTGTVTIDGTDFEYTATGSYTVGAEEAITLDSGVSLSLNSEEEMEMTYGDTFTLTDGTTRIFFDADGSGVVGDDSATTTLEGSVITLSGNTIITGIITENVPDDTQDAYDLQEGTNNYINLSTINGAEKIEFGNTTTNPAYYFLGSGDFNVAGSSTFSDTLNVTGATNLSSNLNVTGAAVLSSTLNVIGDIQIASGSDLYTYGSITLGNRNYTQNYYLTDAQTLTASLDTLDQSLYALSSGSNGLWRDQGSYIYPNNYSSFVITDSGTVGIGTTSPQAKLDIASDLSAISGGIVLNLGQSILDDLDDYYIYMNSTNWWQNDRLKALNLATNEITGAVCAGSTCNININPTGNGYTALNVSGGYVGIGTTNPGSKLQINTGADATIGQIIRANFGSQTANLSEWQDSIGTVLSSINSLGYLNTSQVNALNANGLKLYDDGGNGIFIGDGGYVGMGTTDISSSYRLTVNGNWRMTNSAGSVRARFTLSGMAGSPGYLSFFDGSDIETIRFHGGSDSAVLGKFGVGMAPGSVPSAQLQINSGANSIIGQIIRGYSASQSANLTEWQSSVGTVMSYVDRDGKFTIGTSTSTGPMLSINAANYQTQISFKRDGNAYASISYSSGPTLYFTTSSGDLFLGAYRTVRIAGNNETHAHLAIDSNGVVVNPEAMIPNSTVMFTVKGTASQTANLTEWQNSSGTILSKVSNNGVITAPNFISTVAIGTQPYATTSTTLNLNLNADLLDGYHGSGLGSVIDHGSLLDLSADDHTQYALLLGRSSGQTLIGGTTTTADLTFQTTSGAGTTGADMHFLVGNNGGTEAMTILNSGYVGIGTTNPITKLEIAGDFKVSTTGGGLLVSGNATSPNILGGYSGNSIAAGIWGATINGGGTSGFVNTINGSGNYGVIGGGTKNTLSTSAGVIGGGYNNTLSGGINPVIGGGNSNTINANYSTIAGGVLNSITNDDSFIGGGRSNSVSGLRGVIGGGRDNTISGDYSMILGGRYNTASGSNAFAAGYRAKATAQGVFVLSDSTEADFTVGTTNVFGGRFSGGYWLTGGNVGIGTTGPEAKLHINTGADTTIGQILRANSGSQSANLTEWQNSGGGVLSSVGSTGIITAPNFISTVAIGTQPYATTSTTLNLNLNADLLDGYHGSGLGSVIDHGSLLDLSADDHTQYLYLAGRTSGQTIIGGTTTTADLTFQTTSEAGAAGADMHFLVGNNGGTEAMTILNNGYIGIGTTAPISKVDIISSTNSLLTLGSGNTATWSLKGGDGTGWADATYERVQSMITHNGKLYAGLGNGTGDAEVWEYNGSSWTKIGGDGIGWADATYEYIWSMTSYNGKLYAGLGSTAGDAEVWEYNGSSWTKIGGDGIGWADATYEIVYSMTSYNGKLYAGLGNGTGDAEVWEYNGSSWTKIGGDGTGWAGAIYEVVGSLTTYNNKLYAGLGYNSSGDAEVWEYNGFSWTKIGGDGTGWADATYTSVLSLASYNGKLYAGLGSNTKDAEVWEYDGSFWIQVGGDGTEWADATYEGVYSMTSYNGKLYAGLGFSAGDAEVWEYNGSSWTKIGGDGTGWADATYEEVYSMTSYNGKLYAGIGQGTGEAEIWEYNGSSYTNIARNGVGLSLGDYLYLGNYGYVGINNNQPEATLDLNGTLRINDSLFNVINGSVGIGTASPSSLFSVGSSSQFQVNTSGAIAAAAGVASSGNIDFSSLSAGGLIKAAATTGRLSIASAGTDYEVPLTFTNGLTRATNTIKLGGTLTENTSLAQSTLTWSQSFSGDTGTGFTYSANSLSSGKGLYITSTSTALTTGNLLALDWSPGSATTATGDLFSINIGSNGNIGNLFNVKDNGSSLFSVSETTVNFNLPASFTSAGDVVVAYDLVFTNQTASYIQSDGPFSITVGESWESNDLTLKTYNSGNVVFDVGGSIGFNAGKTFVYDYDDGADTYTYFDSTNNRLEWYVDGTDKMRLNASTGDLDLNQGSFDNAAFDVAENYPTFDETIGPGDVVALNFVSPEQDAKGKGYYEVVKASLTNRDNLLGIITTRPGVYLGGASYYYEKCEEIKTGNEDKIKKELIEQTQTEDEKLNNLKQEQEGDNIAAKNKAIDDFVQSCRSAKQVGVSLVGRVPVKATGEYGEIKAGDLLTASATTGYAKKATTEGFVIGRALENVNQGEKKQILAFVLNSYYDPDAQTSLSPSSDPSTDKLSLSELTVIQKAILYDTTVTGSLMVYPLKISDEGLESVGEALQIQPNAFSNIELMGQKIVITTDGNLKVLENIEAKKVIAEEFQVKGTKTVGEGIIKAGSKEIVISNSTITSGAKVFVTPLTLTDKILSVTEIKEGVSFKVEITSLTSQDIRFNWWILGN